jgi:hypothetical protein
MMWSWASTKPGIIVRPPRSTTVVSGPIRLKTAPGPTPTMRSSRTASAVTSLRVGLNVRTFPLMNARSAGGVVARVVVLPAPVVVSVAADVVEDVAAVAVVATTSAVVVEATEPPPHAAAVTAITRTVTSLRRIAHPSLPTLLPDTTHRRRLWRRLAQTPAGT